MMKRQEIKADYRTNKKLAIQKTNTVLRKILVYGFLVLMALIILLPFYWMLNISFQSNNEIFDSLSISFFPQEFSPDNYVKVFLYETSTSAGTTFTRYLTNTLVVAFFSTVFGTIFSILIAFALARLNFKGRDLLFTLLLATMMIPGEMMVISNFITVSRLGWVHDPGIGSYLAMIVPFLVSIFHVYLLRQAFKQIPNELDYAAMAAACTARKSLWRVMVPMATSSIITITILKVMGTWNAFIWPDLVADHKFKLVTTWLRSPFTDSTFEVQRPLTNLQMAATVIVTLPLFLLFVIFRKYIMSGVSRSGVKDRKSTRLNSSHVRISYAVFCLKKKKKKTKIGRLEKKNKYNTETHDEKTINYKNNKMDDHKDRTMESYIGGGEVAVEYMTVIEV